MNNACNECGKYVRIFNLNGICDECHRREIPDLIEHFNVIRVTEKKKIKKDDPHEFYQKK
jgi:hypothetical protein